MNKIINWIINHSLLVFYFIVIMLMLFLTCTNIGKDIIEFNQQMKVHKTDDCEKNHDHGIQDAANRDFLNNAFE